MRATMGLLPIALISLISLLSFLPSVNAVKGHDFKTCSQSGFCRRGRALASRAAEADSWESPYSLLKDGLELDSQGSTFKGKVKSALYPDVRFSLRVDVLHDGLFRIRMDEVDGLKKRYDEASKWALVGEPELGSAQWSKGEKEISAVTRTGGERVELKIEYSPLKVGMWISGKEVIALNGRGLLHMEHFRTKEEPAAESSVESSSGEEEQTVLEPAKPTERPTAWFEGAEEDAYWSESFGGNTDSKPKGPESLSLDITFPLAQHLYGIPEHAAPLSLPTTQPPETRYNEPYRLYNLDVFEYLPDSPMALYGSIPLLHAHSKEGTVGALFLTGAETWIDVARPQVGGRGMSTHWVSESGILDLFLLPGPGPHQLFRQYTALTGPSALPQLFALGYHQCRWNYISSKDVLDVNRRFDDALMPLDVTWLDIEYAAEKKYFDWDKSNFPDPRAMVDAVAEAKRKMVAIVDPHLKKTSNYHVYQQAQERDVLIKKSDGKEYEGWCWPGASAYADFFHPDSWQWWRGLFRLGDGKDVKEGEGWIDSTKDLFIWNDMNEPSVFNGPEITMPKDNIHHGGWEHRDVHNLNGMLFHKQTSLALIERTNPPQRPFVLSRSFYPGSQQYGAIWTGDNGGTWEHMKVGLPMVLTLGVTGMAFAGADVGGFFGNPGPEMLTRWYQVGIFAPFFRGHAHIDTKRREPYLLEEPYKSIVRDALELRYAMLPLWYTLMHEASISGTPATRPHYVILPHDEQGFAIDDQYYIGDSMLVKPVTDEGATETSVYLAEDEVYYAFDDYTMYRGISSGAQIIVPSPLEKIPLFYRGGHIIPLRLRPRRSSSLMAQDPFTLVIGLSTKRAAVGELYLDDGESFSFRKGELVWRDFRAIKNGKKGIKIISDDRVPAHPTEAVYGVDLTGTWDPENTYARNIHDVRVERVVVLGLPAAPTSVHAVSNQQKVDLNFKWIKGSSAEGKRGQEGPASVLIIKDPGVGIAKDWEIVVE
ncbi:alpha-glucosidase [Dacryopinax primogenitus]|uniref:Glucosidase II subunit alpha n=1 Tax=Dacryopinax primogenitus (strain DJM 731) TaxID=1858805 RepID=M5FQE8_DACPD|nr:alpha-glucosidase [Dacryopinax primogenitus]EJT96934.1 alpha-glucosidase [Dacryopinax primogenitus]